MPASKSHVTDDDAGNADFIADVRDADVNGDAGEADVTATSEQVRGTFI